MDWKQRDFVFRPVVFVVWTLLTSSKYSFGNYHDAFHTARMTDTFSIKPTLSLSSNSSVFHGFTTLSTSSTFNKLAQLRLTPSSSTHFNLSSSDVVVSRNPNKSSENKTSKIALTKTSDSFSSTQVTSQILTSSTTHGSFMTMSNVYSSSSITVFMGPNKTFIAEIRIRNLNFSSELDNNTSPLFRATASSVAAAINIVMMDERYYLGCEIVSFREGSIIVHFEIRMRSGSSTDPNVALDRLRTAVAAGRVGNLTVDSTYFQGWMKQNLPPREKLLYGQLAGVAVILFILVVILLVICLGNFADEPLFEERELFSAELMQRRNIEMGRDNEGNKDDEWKFDPLFAWSPQRTFDSKL